MSTSIKGDLPEIRLITRATLEKRVRRTLAAKGHRLLKSRPGTAAFREFGCYAVENGLRHVIATHQAIDSLARELGVMDEQEYIDPHSDWRWIVVRQHSQRIGGKNVLFNDRISRLFRTREEAEAHAETITVESGAVGIVGYRQEDGYHV